MSPKFFISIALSATAYLASPAKIQAQSHTYVDVRAGYNEKVIDVALQHGPFQISVLQTVENQAAGVFIVFIFGPWENNKRLSAAGEVTIDGNFKLSYINATPKLNDDFATVLKEHDLESVVLEGIINKQNRDKAEKYLSN